MTWIESEGFETWKLFEKWKPILCFQDFKEASYLEITTSRNTQVLRSVFSCFEMKNQKTSLLSLIDYADSGLY